MISFFRGVAMTVYVEYVLIDNFIIDYLILKATFAITAKKIAKGRLFICALILSIFALIFPLLNLNGVIGGLIKILYGMLCIIFAYEYKTLNEYVGVVLVFFALTFLTGGFVTALYQAFGIPFGNKLTISLAVIPICSILKICKVLFNYLTRKVQVTKFLYKTQISVGKITVDGVGFLDTGNVLYDGNFPCVICSVDLAKKFLEGGIFEIKKIPVQTVNGNSQKIAIQSATVKIYTPTKTNIHNNVTLVVSNKAFSDGYQIILHPSLIKESYDKSNCAKTEKVS